MSTRALNLAHAASTPWMAQTSVLALDINRPILNLPLRMRPLSLHVFKQKLNDHLPKLWQKMLWDTLSLRLILTLSTECCTWPYDHTRFVLTVPYHVQQRPWKRAHLQLHSASSPKHVSAGPVGLLRRPQSGSFLSYTSALGLLSNWDDDHGYSLKGSHNVCMNRLK